MDFNSEYVLIDCKEDSNNTHPLNIEYCELTDYRQKCLLSNEHINFYSGIQKAFIIDGVLTIDNERKEGKYKTLCPDFYSNMLYLLDENGEIKIYSRKINSFTNSLITGCYKQFFFQSDQIGITLDGEIRYFLNYCSYIPPEGTFSEMCMSTYFYIYKREDGTLFFHPRKNMEYVDQLTEIFQGKFKFITTDDNYLSFLAIREDDTIMFVNLRSENISMRTEKKLKVKKIKCTVYSEKNFNKMITKNIIACITDDDFLLCMLSYNYKSEFKVVDFSIYEDKVVFIRRDGILACLKLDTWITSIRFLDVTNRYLRVELKFVNGTLICNALSEDFTIHEFSV